MQFKLLKKNQDRFLNVGLRMLPMAAKMVLTLYMGRYFSLSEMGVYGLVIGAVLILSVVMGQDLVYVVSRDIVGNDPATQLHKMRDQAVYYILNFVVLGFLMFGAAATHSIDISPQILLYTFILTVFECMGSVTYANQNSMNQQIQANALFFIRAGLWVIPLIALCVISPELRTADTVLVFWIGGSALSLLALLWCWRGMPWREVFWRPINWGWITRGLKKSWLIWLGMIGLTCGMFVDRFVVEHYLSIENVGVLTFYFSFTNALLTLMLSGVSAFATPRLIQHHRNNAHAEFLSEAWQARKQIAVSAGVIAVLLGVAVPILGHFLGREAFVSNAPVFWMMLAGTFLRANSDILNNILYAQHEDRAIWLGNMLFLIPALGGNLLFVPLFDFNGIGISSIIASAFILAWRWHFAKRAALAKRR